MTHDKYKAALDAVFINTPTTFTDLKELAVFLKPHWGAIKSSLQLAQEASDISESRNYWRLTAHRLSDEHEQLRKERDELAKTVLFTTGGNMYWNDDIKKAKELAKKVNENGNA